MTRAKNFDMGMHQLVKMLLFEVASEYMLAKLFTRRMMLLLAKKSCSDVDKVVYKEDAYVVCLQLFTFTHKRKF
ncbi:hypothetical protein CY34DRAFT_326368 [Suillus luteus UH-Slu-Lm8-n1]|uniref:Uncharacterized protein n=1 Tax=Suillus luteus UH-Slu-Lm8-n1 TaxID=930992 RepID=A0A0D0B6X4_9AGAM|nr:hypothetical protein CY34DRAFT_326368 [Suillus luteus UH-Slu-Lm8-n1]